MAATGNGKNKRTRPAADDWAKILRRRLFLLLPSSVQTTPESSCAAPQCRNKLCADAKLRSLPNKFALAAFRVNEAVASASGGHHDLARIREIELGVIIFKFNELR